MTAPIGRQTDRLRRRIVALLAVSACWLMTTSVALAHGDHDARPLLRNGEAGPHSVSLWQVYPEAGSSMTPHLIVTFAEPTPEGTRILVEVNSERVEVVPSMTTPGAWETTVGLGSGDVVVVSIADPTDSWELPPVVVPPPLTSMLPMRALIMISIFLATGVAWWAAGRTSRAWRRPLPEA